MDEKCQNYGETNIECACMQNKCRICGESVGNITFTRCDAHWEKDLEIHYLISHLTNNK